MARLVLIDGHAILHRAYHALPPTIKNNAIFGFTTMLLRVLSDLKPDYLAVAFDRAEANFRQQQYTQYQAKRPEMEGNLVDQIPLVHEMLEALKIPYFEVAGFEADDCIGTLAAQAVHGGHKFTVHGKSRSSVNSEPSSTVNDVIIVTGDRDMLQLVNKNTRVCVPVKGLSETKIYDEQTIYNEYSVYPSQWVDVKALKGDASDNYPGVRGIGPKTAQELIGIYGNLEELFKHLSELDVKTAMKLAEGAEDAGLAKKLATIVTDVPGVKLQLDNVAVSEINWRQGVKFMREKLGFKSIPERIEKEYLNKASNTVTQSPDKDKTSKGRGENDNEQLGLI